MKKKLLILYFVFGLYACTPSDPKAFEIREFNSNLLEDKDFKNAFSKLSDQEKNLLQAYLQRSQEKKLSNLFSGELTSLEAFPVTIGSAIQKEYEYQQKEITFRKKLTEASYMSRESLNEKIREIDYALSKSIDPIEIKDLKRERSMYTGQFSLIQAEEVALHAEREALEAQRIANSYK